MTKGNIVQIQKNPQKKPSPITIYWYVNLRYVEKKSFTRSYTMDTFRKNRKNSSRKQEEMTYYIQIHTSSMRLKQGECCHGMDW